MTSTFSELRIHIQLNSIQLSNTSQFLLIHTSKMSWPWSSSSSASSSNTRTPLVPPQFDTAAEAGSSAGPSKQASLNLATSDLTASPIPEESPSVGSRVSEASGSVNRYERILKDEEKYQAKQYPTFEEVPGCMQLLCVTLSCFIARSRMS